MRDAAKTAACFLLNLGLDQYVKDERKDIIKAALKNNINTVPTSSMEDCLTPFHPFWRFSMKTAMRENVRQCWKRGSFGSKAQDRA